MIAHIIQVPDEAELLEAARATGDAKAQADVEEKLATQQSWLAAIGD